MFWLRNKKNNFLVRTLSGGLVEMVTVTQVRDSETYDSPVVFAVRILNI